MLFDLTSRTIIITGGAGQLGQQYSYALMNSGANVVVFDLHPPKDDAISFFEVNITDKQSIENGLRQVIEKWGVPHGLVNNAALDSPPNAPAEENGPFETYPEASWDRVLDVNLKGTFLCCQVIGGAMAKAGRGSIINIGSIYGELSPVQPIYEYRAQDGGAPFFKPVAYSASKSGVVNLTRYLATYWAKRGVRVNTLTLAGVFNNQDEQFLANYTARIPIGRMANSDEYNGAVIFLLSDASSYMTGSNMVIDGGWTAW
jgi:NAD(P)-dependent dehydrogenase (short-subunit alcohol dehydrogenase family)